MPEPAPPDPTWPRYTHHPFPAYRYVPGLSAHPRRDPDGHSAGRPEPTALPFAPDAWKTSQTYLYGIDLYNFAYWWECHEQLEALWHAVGEGSEMGSFLQGVIQVAAASLQSFRGNVETARALAYRGLARHEGLTSPYMGLDLPLFRDGVTGFFEHRRALPAFIRLEGAIVVGD